MHNEEEEPEEEKDPHRDQPIGENPEEDFEFMIRAFRRMRERGL